MIKEWSESVQVNQYIIKELSEPIQVKKYTIKKQFEYLMVNQYTVTLSNCLNHKKNNIMVNKRHQKGVIGGHTPLKIDVVPVFMK